MSFLMSWRSPDRITTPASDPAATGSRSGKFLLQQKMCLSGTSRISCSSLATPTLRRTGCLLLPNCISRLCMWKRDLCLFNCILPESTTASSPIMFLTFYFTRQRMRSVSLQRVGLPGNGDCASGYYPSTHTVQHHASPHRMHTR